MSTILLKLAAWFVVSMALDLAARNWFDGHRYERTMLFWTR